MEDFPIGNETDQSNTTLEKPMAIQPWSCAGRDVSWMFTENGMSSEDWNVYSIKPL